MARFEAERRNRALQRYADFFESSADGIVVMDSDGYLLFSNPRARVITGYDEHDLEGRQLGELFADEGLLASKLRAGFHRGEFPQGVDIRIKQRMGSVVVVSVNFNSVLREDGAVLCTLRDVTRERAVDAELVKTKDFLERVIDSSVDAIISADMDGKIVLFNRAAERIYGTSADAVLGTHVSALYPEGGAKKIMRLIRQGKGRVEGIRAEILDHAGTLIPVTFSGGLIYDREVAIGSVGIFTDLREKMRMEQRLQAAQDRLIQQERQAVIAELAGGAAHELNQPLTSVMSYAAMLRRLLEKGTSAYNAAEVIEGEAERMAEIVRKIGKITRYETKSYVGQQKILDLDKASEGPASEVKRSTIPAEAPRSSAPPSSRSSGPPLREGNR